MLGTDPEIDDEVVAFMSCAFAYWQTLGHLCTEFS